MKKSAIFSVFFFVIALCLTGLLCFLGHWQLGRYEYKKDLLRRAANSLSGPAEKFDGAETPPEFARLSVTGIYDNSLTVLVQNKIKHGRPGVEVLTPLQIAHEKKLLLVDRGWLALPDANTSRMPVIPAATSGVAVTGHVRKAGEYQFILGANILAPALRPLAVQKIDLAEISSIFHKEFYPFILRLDRDAPDGFIRDWTVTTMQPQQHFGYAIQWLTMAFVLFVMSVYFCFFRSRKS